MDNPKVGALRVLHIPQVPMKGFYVPVDSLVEAAKISQVLADYDLFQFENNIKPDYCNVTSVQQYVEDAGEGRPGWCDWYDEETGEDNVVEFLKNNNTNKYCKNCGTKQ